MTVAHFYLYREKIIVPTVVQADAGFYMDSHPVHVFEIADHDNIKRTIGRALVDRNKIVPTPRKSADGGSVLLDALQLKKWSSFEQFAVMYSVFLGGRYATIYATGRGPDGMWSQEATRLREFHPSVPIGVLVDAIMGEMAKEPEARSERFGLAVIPKTESDEVLSDRVEQS
jgi:hypothetical protein